LRVLGVSPRNSSIGNLSVITEWVECEEKKNIRHNLHPDLQKQLVSIYQTLNVLWWMGPFASSTVVITLKIVFT
jgi:hypothetical protein